MVLHARGQPDAEFADELQLYVHKHLSALARCRLPGNEAQDDMTEPVCSVMAQILGGYGYLEDFPV